MDVLNIKIEENLLKEIDDVLVQHRYSTRTEFVRDAIRDKLADLEKEDILRQLVSLKGVSKRKTTDGQLHEARDKLAEVLEKRFT